MDPRPSRLRSPRLRAAAAFLALALVVLGVGLVVVRGGDGPETLTLDVFEERVADGEVATATILDRDHAVVGELDDGTEYRVTFPAEYGDELVTLLREADGASVELDTDQQRDAPWVSVLWGILPILVLVGLFFFVLRTVQGGGAASRFGKAKARRLTGNEPSVTFADVAGCDEAVEELREIRDFLAEPARFQALGARIPKGVLLVGPPGTGKTLLARAVAGEAGVPFFTISGSDFVEMYVGVGASRVRDLFQQAKAAAPAIVFVDEIDAVGRHRGAGTGGGHDEREQTLNQLLVEMDGFDVSSGVILVAATNRPDILDPALLRPGRFDRHIVVDPPDLAGRRAILAVHARGKPVATADGDHAGAEMALPGHAVDLDVLARRTAGFTGADLANLLNEAALLTARNGRQHITMVDCAAAIDRVVAGPERRTRVLSTREKRIIAYHESGHALVGHLLAGTDPIHKVSIVARGRALGWTLALPTEDRVLRSRSELRDTLAMLLGGRTAEELVVGDPTTGAQDDIERATRIARSMVTEWGMSDAVGPQQLVERGGEPFLGRAAGAAAVVQGSERVAGLVDAEVRRLLDDAHAEAREVLVQHRATLDRLAEALVTHETLEEQALDALFADLEPWRGILADPDRSAEPLVPTPVVAVPVAEVPAPARAVPPTRASRARWTGWRTRLAGRLRGPEPGAP
ncbi:MAG: ATP-dependent zinc metalloprotease FtsH [Acidimicrobiales bacterium]